MRSRTGGNVVALAGWLLLAAILLSFLNQRDACEPVGIWTSWWILTVPVFGVVAALDGPAAAPVIAGMLLIGAWSALASLWLLSAIVAGACQGG